MNVLIITGGHIDGSFAKRYIKDRHFDRIIAADAGLFYCRELHLTPTDILGDFDSLNDRELLLHYQEEGIPIHTFPARKDYSDTHLALQFAMDLQPTRITILGGTGTRYDHALANIGLLQWVLRHGGTGQKISCVIVDEHNEIEMLRGPAQKTYQKDQNRPFFSLLPWGGKAEGITLTGFSYPLENGTLTTEESLGISNEIIAEEGRIEFKSGYLLAIRSND